MGGALTVLSLGGIPVRIHASWVLVYALITWTLAVGYFPSVLPEQPRAAAWVSGLIAALLLFVSVLLHELSHALVALAHGLRVRAITLHVFGGVSHIEGEPPTPRAEFLIAVVGPLTSFAVAGVLRGLMALGLPDGGPVGAIATYLVLVNLAVGVFNLIPGFPLDGGRLLRAALWQWKGSLGVATFIASRIGLGFAFALMAVGVLRIFAGALVDGFWMILIGLFLRGAADASYVQVALQEAIGRLPVREIMARDVVTIRPDATIAELVDAFWAHHFASFPVVEDGAVRGIASIQQIHRVPRDRWAQTRVSEVMRPLGDDLAVRPEDSVLLALQKAAQNGVGRLAVREGSRLVGYLSLKDISHVLALHGLAASSDPAMAGGLGAQPRLPRAA